MNARAKQLRSTDYCATCGCVVRWGNPAAAEMHVKVIPASGKGRASVRHVNPVTTRQVFNESDLPNLHREQFAEAARVYGPGHDGKGHLYQ